MVNRALIFPAIAAALLFSAASCSNSSKNIAEKVDSGSAAEVVARHDSAMRSEIGIGIREVGLAAQMRPEVFLLEDAMQPAEKVGFQALVEGGYATSETMKTADGAFVRYQLTDKGRAIQKAVH